MVSVWPRLSAKDAPENTAVLASSAPSTPADPPKPRSRKEKLENGTGQAQFEGGKRIPRRNRGRGALRCAEEIMNGIDVEKAIAGR